MMTSGRVIKKKPISALVIKIDSVQLDHPPGRAPEGLIISAGFCSFRFINYDRKPSKFPGPLASQVEERVQYEDSANNLVPTAGSPPSQTFPWSYYVSNYLHIN